MSSSGLSRATEDFVIYLIDGADEGILHTVESSSIKIQRAGRRWLRVDCSPVWVNLYTDSALRPRSWASWALPWRRLFSSQPHPHVFT